MSLHADNELGTLASRTVWWPQPQAPPSAPAHRPLSLCVGIITTTPKVLFPLLCDLGRLATYEHIKRLVVLVLDNASPGDSLAVVVGAARALPLQIAVVSVAQQRMDASHGAFGTRLHERPKGRMGIATARTMLQRYLGEVMKADSDAFGWVLDDDMRVDARARWYLSWLPAFREDGLDVLIGACEGVSPNPPLHGVQCRLVDLFHNMLWLQGLPTSAMLPDRSAENAALRARFPDYYYDLSRKHSEHLSQPFWIEPVSEGESVPSAYARLIEGAHGILRGEPLTRPVIAPMPQHPLTAARDSVNRGGHTFVLTHRALTMTPNTAVRLGARETRRSDMLWAIVNRQYRRMKIRAVAFPVVHVGLASDAPVLDIEKVQDEVLGAAVYAALAEFLRERPWHTLAFSSAETQEVVALMRRHRDRRLEDLQSSLCRVGDLRDSLRRVARGDELSRLIAALDTWFTSEILEEIRVGVLSSQTADIEVFLESLQAIADDYASATPVDITPLHAQLAAGAAT
ncbi:MAG: hypothetical protein ACT4PL_10215 [Phycisphaerales bacterium]